MYKTLGPIVASVLLSAISPTVATAQTGEPTACSILDRAELRRITGQKEIAGLGPEAADPAGLPKGITECDYLGLGFQLTSPINSAGFAGTRDTQVKAGTKIQAIAGLGDEGYYWWDPKPGNDRQVGIAFRSGARRLIIMDMTSADSMEVVKPRLLAVAKLLAPKLR